jgi:hypothetical protein
VIGVRSWQVEPKESLIGYGHDHSLWLVCRAVLCTELAGPLSYGARVARHCGTVGSPWSPLRITLNVLVPTLSSSLLSSLALLLLPSLVLLLLPSLALLILLSLTALPLPPLVASLPPLLASSLISAYDRAYLPLTSLLMHLPPSSLLFSFPFPLRKSLFVPCSLCTCTSNYVYPCFLGTTIQHSMEAWIGLRTVGYIGVREDPKATLGGTYWYSQTQYVNVYPVHQTASI